MNAWLYIENNHYSDNLIFNNQRINLNKFLQFWFNNYTYSVLGFSKGLYFWKQFLIGIIL